MISRQSSRQISLVAAAVLFTATCAMAQQSNTGNGQTAPPGQQQSMSGQIGSSGVMMTSGNGSAFPSQIDEAFVRDTLEHNQAQLQMCQLAQQKSPSQDVKQYGQQMFQIHTQLGDQLKPLARQLGVSDRESPSKKEKQEIAKLETLSGPQFDIAYIQDMAREQQNGVKTFKEEARVAQNPNVMQAAKMDEPVLSQHLQVLQKLAQTHNVTLANKK